MGKVRSKRCKNGKRKGGKLGGKNWTGKVRSKRCKNGKREE